VKNAKLWPVASSLAVLLVGSVAVEYSVRHREVAPLRVRIVDAATGSDDADIDEIDDPGSPPLSTDQLLARQTAKRGDYEQALAIYARLHEQAGATVALATEYAHWLLRAGQVDAAKQVLVQAQQKEPQAPQVALQLGLVADRTGDFSEAQTQFETALKGRPNHSATRIALGDLLRRKHQLGEAIAVIEPATKSGSNEERARALTVLGRCHVERGELATARKLLAEAVERAPASVNIWVGAVNAYLESKDPRDLDAALTHALKLSQLAPELGLAQRLLGRVYEKRGATHDAALAFRHSLTLDADSTMARERLARLALDDDDFKAAREQLQILLKLNPNQAEYHFLAGLVEARDSHPEQAAAFYQQAIDLEPHYPEAWFNLGKVRLQTGNVELSVAAYQRAIEEKPDYTSAWNNLGRIYLDTDRLVLAKECFDKALELSPAYAAAWHNLARLHYKEKRFGESAEAYEKAATLSPDDRTLTLMFAISLRKAGNEQRAIETYEKLLQRSPRYVTAWFNLGVAYGASERISDARRAYEKALEYEPGHAGSLKNLGYLEANEGHHDRAAVYLNEALDQDPTDEDARLKLAELRLAAEDSAGCRSEVERVLSRNQSNLSARAMLARCSN
jgi:tetratricopeptide (TPR) repeat protein